jgi:hypothetical protein
MNKPIPTDVRGTHTRLRVPTSTVFADDGRRRTDAFLACGSVLVRVVGLWTMLRALLGWSKLRDGVLVLDDAKRMRPPVVLLGWEAYSRLLVGLSPERLASVGLDGDVRRLAAAEHEATTDGGGGMSS